MRGYENFRLLRDNHHDDNFDDGDAENLDKTTPIDNLGLLGYCFWFFCSYMLAKQSGVLLEEEKKT